jgi:redox-sensitive bicupin YhaK (pirin superfamily)
MMPVSVEIRRASDCFVEKGEGRLSRHSLSFGARYDPDNLRFGPMICHDDHLLGNGRGFDPHRHEDLVIVSWVLSGALRHTGPDGSATVEPGQVAVLRTGAGVEHSEVAAAPQTRFVQVWLDPGAPADPSGTADPPAGASYDVVAPELTPGALTRVAEPVPGAVFSVARCETGDTVTLPAGPLVHVYVARGALLRSSLAEPLQEGDAFRFTDTGAHEVTAAVPTELLVWELPA